MQGAHRMICAGQRGAKEGREPVLRHLTHEPLDPMHLGHQQGQAARQHVVHRLGHFPWVAGVRPFDTGDEHRCDLAFADDALLTGQDFAGDVGGGIGAGRSRTDVEGDRHVSGHSAATAPAEAFSRVVAKSTVQARLPQRLATRGTELPRSPIGRLTLRTRQGSGRGGAAPPAAPLPRRPRAPP